ncbi:hypothetical protein E3N88_04003 [Mikania micrantha]|uniref:Uncharacterized protein n=1 Tax=Mikania micrantha TaxID=192012 RepID=A0A5N6PT64_9ASTR|nr:hypothetical protein E3N88_04003 [Mikania micrantha]
MKHRGGSRDKAAGIRKPLQTKLKKDYVWEWKQSDTDYLKTIKKNLISFPKLYLPKEDDFLIIETDASNDFWGGVLKAKNAEKEESERKKSESIPCQTAKGKEKSSPLIPVALEKSKNKVNQELQSSYSPVANGSGKDISNSLIADSLQKTDKSIVSKYVTEKPFPFKKFGSLLQAQQEATRYSAEFGKKEIPLKVTISPEPFNKKKEKIIEFKKNFSKTAVIPNEEIEEEKDFISLDEFRIVWSKARCLSQDEFEIEHLYTEDKATKSLIICCPGANPEIELGFLTKWRSKGDKPTVSYKVATAATASWDFGLKGHGTKGRLCGIEDSKPLIFDRVIQTRIRYYRISIIVR